MRLKKKKSRVTVMGKQSKKRGGNGDLWATVGGHLNGSPVLDTSVTLNKTRAKSYLSRGTNAHKW